MTSLLGAKKRAEEFAAAVDGGADRSGLHPDLAELVGVVSTLRREAETTAQLTPHPEFTAALRERLMAEAATSLPQDNVLTLPTRRKGTRERRLALVASSIVLVGGTAGMAAAAQNALPGEALYPIKRGIENAQVDLATDKGARGEDLLDQADSRLVEVQGLFDGSSDLSQVPGTIDDFTQQAIEASTLLLDEFDETRDPEIIDALHTFATDNLAELQDLAKTAPPEHQDELALAAQTLLEIDQRAQAACPTCADTLDSLKMPTLFLTAVEAQQAMDAVHRVKLNNDHPVITDEGKPQQDKDGKSATDEGDAPDGTTGGTDTPDQPEGSGLPGLPPGEVDTNGPDGNGGKGLPDTVGEGAGDVVGDTGDKIKESLPDELDGAVGTLLP
jgi:hypothetical protein